MTTLPPCMMPDGGEACVGYDLLTQENNQLRAEIKELSDLVERAIRNARGGRTCKLWVAVMYAFGCGSGKAQAICKRYGYDPESELRQLV